MVTAESLCCGTTVIGFKSGAPETITIPEYSTFVNYGDISALKSQIEKFLSQFIDKNSLSQIAKKKYSAENMYRSYMEFYNHIFRC